MRLSPGRVAVVTGAAGGIGRAICVALAGRGCDLSLVDVDEAGLRETALEAYRERPEQLCTFWIPVEVGILRRQVRPARLARRMPFV